MKIEDMELVIFALAREARVRGEEERASAIGDCLAIVRLHSQVTIVNKTEEDGETVEEHRAEEVASNLRISHIAEYMSILKEGGDELQIIKLHHERTKASLRDCKQLVKSLKRLL